MGSKLFTCTCKRAKWTFHRLTPSVYVIPSVFAYPVSFRKFGPMWSSLALGHRQPRRYADGKTISSSLLSLHLHPCQVCTVALVRFVPSPLPAYFFSSSFAPYSIPPSPSILTGYGVCFQKRQEYRLRGSVHLMPWTGGSFLLASLLTRRDRTSVV